MNDDIEVTFSCDIFGGYKTNIQMDKIKATNDIVDLSIKSLHSHLDKYGMVNLKSILSERKYHIHDKSLLDIFIEKKVYVCFCKR